LAIVSTLLEEAAIAVVALVGLPQLGIEVPLWLLVVIMAAWAALAVFTYRMGSRALRRKPVAGLPSVVGSSGAVVSRLAPEGLVRVGGELWVAKASSGQIEVGEEVIVVTQDRTRLTVRQSGNCCP